MTEDRTQFDYLLNAYTHAAQAERPAAENFSDKRLALFAYVRQLEAVAKQGGREQRYLDAIRWALGSNGEFPGCQPGQGAYWWRIELMKRAGLAWDGEQFQPNAEHPHD